uniref:DUF2802 domain-containing protein n=1 Tax=Magnetococcus massalia (strain MO-1) TaxID=451514 RepID=A0A1S7LK59_MAGMO|nr:conserved exported protein of unknown function [Candidatus Magnetococcus massalia]
MSLWNLLVVVCFAILYFGLALVFSQLKSLRAEIQATMPEGVGDDLGPIEPMEMMADQQQVEAQASAQTENILVESREQTEIILEELAGVEDRILRTVEGIPVHMQEGLEEISKELRYLDRGQGAQNDSGNNSVQRNVGAKPDAYREAKLLLSNGVDEERVIDETGLTVEEVSLLKRLSGAQAGREVG